MDWQLSGTRYADGMPGVLGWDDLTGRITGDRDTLAVADAYLRDHENILAVTPTGPFWTYDKSDPVHVWALAVLVLGSGGSVVGVPPTFVLPELPEGAIP